MVGRSLRVRHEIQAVIFDEVGNDKKVLLLKKLDFSAKRFRWRLLKGGVKEGETEAEALRREVFEETGLKNVKILSKVHRYEFVFRNTKHLVSSYLTKVNSRELVKLQKSEVADYIWITKEEALNLLYWNNEKEAIKQLK